MRKVLVLLGLAMLLCSTACVQTPPPAPVAPVPQFTAEDHFNEGMRMFNAGDFNSASNAFTQAANMSPNFVEAHFYLAVCYEKMGMTDRAEGEYRRCIAINSQYLPAHESLGLMLYRLGRFGMAKAELETCGALNSVLPDVYFSLAEIYRMEGKCGAAIKAYKHALRLNPGFYAAQTGLDQARRACRGPGYKPKVKYEKTFTGGAVAIDPKSF